MLLWWVVTNLMFVGSFLTSTRWVITKNTLQSNSLRGIKRHGLSTPSDPFYCAINANRSRTWLWRMWTGVTVKYLFVCYPVVNLRHKGVYNIYKLKRLSMEDSYEPMNYYHGSINRLVLCYKFFHKLLHTNPSKCFNGMYPEKLVPIIIIIRNRHNQVQHLSIRIYYFRT